MYNIPLMGINKPEKAVNILYYFFLKFIRSISCEGHWVHGYNNEQTHLK